MLCLPLLTFRILDVSLVFEDLDLFKNTRARVGVCIGKAKGFRMSNDVEVIRAELAEAEEWLRSALNMVNGDGPPTNWDGMRAFLNRKSKPNVIAVLEDLRDELRKWEKHRFGIADELSSYEWRKEGDKHKLRADILDVVIAERVFTPTHLHKKSGKTYQVIATGIDATNTYEGRHTVIYRNENGDWFTRLAHEFYDGRFVAVAKDLEKC